MAEQRPPEQFRIDVAEDHLSATLFCDGTGPVTAVDMIALLKDMKIQLVDVPAIIAGAADSGRGPVSFVVTKGIPPTDEKPGRITFKIPVSDAKLGTVSSVDAGQLIARTTKSIPGTDGRDIFGKPVPHKRNSLPFRIAPNIKFKNDEIIADEAGNLRMKDDCLCIVPLLEVDGDDNAHGPIIISDGDVAIKGSLREGRGVNTKGSLIVNGSVRSSILKIGGSTFATGGLIGKNKSKCVIGEELRCAFITAAAIVAGGDVHVQTEIQGSRIFCSGQLKITRGPIVGGEISANGGLVCQTIGNLAGIPTVVGAGTDRVTKSLQAAATAESDAYKKRIADTRSKIAPLMEKLKSLTPTQRERVTELMYEADELEAKNEEMLAELFKRNQLMLQRARAEILVAEMIYPGVKIILPGAEATVAATIQGPIKISVGQAENGRTIMVTETTSGSTFALTGAAANDYTQSSRQTPLKAAA